MVLLFTGWVESYLKLQAGIYPQHKNTHKRCYPQSHQPNHPTHNNVHTHTPRTQPPKNVHWPVVFLLVLFRVVLSKPVSERMATKSRVWTSSPICCSSSSWSLLARARDSSSAASTSVLRGGAKRFARGSSSDGGEGPRLATARSEERRVGKEC